MAFLGVDDMKVPRGGGDSVVALDPQSQLALVGLTGEVRRDSHPSE